MMSQPVLRLWAREWLLGRRSLIMHTILCVGVAIAGNSLSCLMRRGQGP